jgi:hypothetical protein
MISTGTAATATSTLTTIVNARLRGAFTPIGGSLSVPVGIGVPRRTVAGMNHPIRMLASLRFEQGPR